MRYSDVIDELANAKSTCIRKQINYKSNYIYVVSLQTVQSIVLATVLAVPFNIDKQSDKDERHDSNWYTYFSGLVLSVALLSSEHAYQFAKLK